MIVAGIERATVPMKNRDALSTERKRVIVAGIERATVPMKNRDALSTKRKKSAGMNHRFS